MDENIVFEHIVGKLTPIQILLYDENRKFFWCVADRPVRKALKFSDKFTALYWLKNRHSLSNDKKEVKGE